MRTISRLLIAAALGVGVAGYAQAAPADDVMSVRVSSAGLDLNSEAGAALFLGRLSRAATKVCGGRPEPAPIELRRLALFQRCRAQAMGGAVAQANSPILSRQFAATRDARVRLAAK